MKKKKSQNFPEDFPLPDCSMFGQSKDDAHRLWMPGCKRERRTPLRSNEIAWLGRFGSASTHREDGLMLSSANYVYLTS